jgi:hypothetical protein
MPKQLKKQCPVRKEQCIQDLCLWWDADRESCYVVTLAQRPPGSEDVKIITGVPRPPGCGKSK